MTILFIHQTDPRSHSLASGFKSDVCVMNADGTNVVDVSKSFRADAPGSLATIAVARAAGRETVVDIGPEILV